MPCEPILCKTCEHSPDDCDLTWQWKVFGSDPNEECECYTKRTSLSEKGSKQP
jgi:hypothetical protein